MDLPHPLTVGPVAVCKKILHACAFQDRLVISPPEMLSQTFDGA